LNFQKYIDTAVELLLVEGPKILLAIIVLLIGLRIIKGFNKLISKGFESGNMDPTLRPFIKGLIEWGLKLLLFISVASMLGIETTSFVAVLGAAGLAIGMSLQGTLSNFAGGVLILVLRPYKVGDWVDCQGEFGGVQEIGIFNTILVTVDSKTVIIPNGAIMNGNITNVTRQGLIRVDLTVGVSYNSDIKRVKETLMNVMITDADVLKDPAPFVGVAELADSAVNFAVRPYCRPEHYWDVYFRVLENSKIALDEAKITIPFPQMDVHVQK